MKVGLYVEQDDGTIEKIDSDEIQSMTAQSGQSVWDWGRAIQCAAACKPRSGFAACVARCMATKQVCDSGVSNCRPL